MPEHPSPAERREWATSLLEGTTPGPWQQFTNDVWGDDGYIGTSPPRKDRTGHVAYVRRGDIEPDQTQANARLIAAAPDLAAAVRDLADENERLRSDLGRGLVRDEKVRQAQLNERRAREAYSEIEHQLRTCGAERDAAREANRSATENAMEAYAERDEAVAERDAFCELLADIFLYIDWRYITKQQTTEQRTLFADVVDAALTSTADRWWLTEEPQPRDRTIDVGYVHTRTDAGDCLSDCPHPSHLMVAPETQP